MATDPRRFDDLTRAVRDLQQQQSDSASTLATRLAGHTHVEGDVANLGTDLSTLTTNVAGKAPTVHTHAATDITGVTFHEAAYTASGGQSIPSTTDTPLEFDTNNYSTTDISIGTSTSGSISNAKFTLNRGGLWIIEGGCRIDSPVSGASYGIWLGPDGGTTRYRAQFQDSGGTASLEFAISVCSRFSSGTALNLYFWHNQGVAHSTVLFNGSNSIRFAWLRP